MATTQRMPKTGNGRMAAVAVRIPRVARRDLFGRVAAWTVRATGGRWGFLTALAVVILWALCGPYFRFSDNWQLFINTGTTIVTFLMVFLIQNAQNRESKAVHLKLDELIFAVKNARNEMIDIECLTEQQLDILGERYRNLAEHHHRNLKGKMARKVDEVGEEVDEVSHRVKRIEQTVEKVKHNVGLSQTPTGRS